MNTAIQSQKITEHNPEPKYCRVLRRLLEGPLHRIEAEDYPVSDHVLNSTVSELKRKGLQINVDVICLPGYSRAGCYVALYSLAPASRQRALQLIQGAK